jgi:hypothetical protein
MVLPEVPGIIEGSMTVSPGPDGTVSFRVLTGSQGAGRDLIELLIGLEDLGRALAEARTGARADPRDLDKRPAFPCHIGFCPNATCAAA